MADTVARTIAAQIGNGAFRMMGAKNLVDHGDGLAFKIGRNAKGVTHVKITLDPSDTYTVEFIRCHGTKVTEKGRDEGVYFDMLHDIIEAGTGLYLRF